MKAAIDIGTNTILLLIAELNSGKVIPFREEQRIPRLGKGVDESRRIDSAAAKRVINVLKEYRQLIEAQFQEVNQVIVTATSAVRDATNRDEFLKQILDESGFKVRLLSGNEEAMWTAAGALSSLKSKPENAAILDIGGGSAEVAVVDHHGELKDSYSFDMGSVRFTEKYLHSNPPTNEELQNCRNAIKKEYELRPFKLKYGTMAVGVAGTLTSLASILQKLPEYQADAVNGYVIKANDISNFIDEYHSKTSDVWLKAYPELLKGRADIFLAGLLILEEFLKFYTFEEITVSAGGIRHGALLLG